jgi:hypothetical protein
MVWILAASLNGHPKENYACLKLNEDLIMLFSAAEYLVLS